MKKKKSRIIHKNKRRIVQLLPNGDLRILHANARVRVEASDYTIRVLPDHTANSPVLSVGYERTGSGLPIPVMEFGHNITLRMKK